MKRLFKFFAVLAVVLASSPGIQAQSLDDMANELVTEIAREFMKPEIQKDLLSDSTISSFKASADGKTLVFDITLKDADFGLLDEEEKAELADIFVNNLQDGFMGNDAEHKQMAEAFSLMGIKFLVRMHDSHGNTITRTVTF